MKARTAPWIGQILHIDLSTGVSSTLPTLPYAEQYLGGRGLAARLAWDMLPPGIRAFDPANVIFIFPGCLIGTPAPSAGRVTICSLSPQGYPDEWYTRSNLGGQWGPELKFAGYDGLVVTGRAPEPVYIQIEDDRRGHDRPRQRSPAGFIHAGDGPGSGGTQRLFECAPAAGHGEGRDTQRARRHVQDERRAVDRVYVPPGFPLLARCPRGAWAGAAQVGQTSRGGKIFEPHPLHTSPTIRYRCACSRQFLVTLITPSNTQIKHHRF